VGEERDPIAAMNNAAGKQDEESAAGKQDEKSDARNANYTDAFDAPDRQGVMGPDNGPQHRAGPGEGIRAPFAQDTGAAPQTSVFDGKGNESVVVMTQDAEGKPSQGTGPSAGSAKSEAEDGDAHPGSAFGHPEED